MKQQINQQIRMLEATLDDHAMMLRRMSAASRRAANELQKDIPDIDRAIDILAEAYPGGRQCFIKAMRMK